MEHYRRQATRATKNIRLLRTRGAIYSNTQQRWLTRVMDSRMMSVWKAERIIARTLLRRNRCALRELFIILQLIYVICNSLYFTQEEYLLDRSFNTTTSLCKYSLVN